MEKADWIVLAWPIGAQCFGLALVLFGLLGAQSLAMSALGATVLIAASLKLRKVRQQSGA